MPTPLLSFFLHPSKKIDALMLSKAAMRDRAANEEKSIKTIPHHHHLSLLFILFSDDCHFSAEVAALNCLALVPGRKCKNAKPAADLVNVLHCSTQVFILSNITLNHSDSLGDISQAGAVLPDQGCDRVASKQKLPHQNSTNPVPETIPSPMQIAFCLEAKKSLEPFNDLRHQ